MSSRRWMMALVVAPLIASAGSLLAKTVVKPPVARTPAAGTAPARTLAARPLAAPVSVGWVKINLLDDPDNPDRPILHKDRDTVSAIWFRDLTHGLIGTMEGEGRSGGAIFTAAGPKD